MKYIITLLIFTSLSLNVSSQLNYYELMDLNTLFKKEVFEAVKTLLKIKGYQIYTDNENYDHGSYFAIAEIQAKIKLGEELDMPEYVKGTDLINIYDIIDITFHEREEYKDLVICNF